MILVPLAPFKLAYWDAKDPSILQSRMFETEADARKAAEALSGPWLLMQNLATPITSPQYEWKLLPGGWATPYSLGTKSFGFLDKHAKEIGIVLGTVIALSLLSSEE